MDSFQNLRLGFYDGIGQFEVPEVNPVHEIPQVDSYIEFDWCKRVIAVRKDRTKIGVHFFEYDYQFERVWTKPDRYAEMLSQFGFVIGPDFSIFDDFPLAVRIFNQYRNNWLVKYWQEQYNMCVVPTILWGDKSTWSWCFDGKPKKSIVAVSTVGVFKGNENKTWFMNGYEEMLKRLEPTKILVFSRDIQNLPGNVVYIPWTLHKGEQLDGTRT